MYYIAISSQQIALFKSGYIVYRATGVKTVAIDLAILLQKYKN